MNVTTWPISCVFLFQPKLIGMALNFVRFSHKDVFNVLCSRHAQGKIQADLHAFKLAAYA